MGPVPRDPRLAVKTVGVTRPVVVARSGTRLGRGPVPAKMLAKRDLFVFGKEGDLFFDAVSTFLEQHGLKNKARIQVANIQTLKALVLAGSGITILPDYTVVEPGLLTRPLQGLHITHPIWMATRNGAAEIPAIAAVLELAQ